MINFEFDLDEDQKVFVDKILSPEINTVFCNSCAGTGKTTMSFGAANILVQDKRTNYKGILYVVSPYGEKKQGYVPGNQEEKSKLYFNGAYRAMIKNGINPNVAVVTDSMAARKRGDAYIEMITDTYLLGQDEEDLVVIIDEAQNFTLDQLKTTLTRFHDNCKVIVIGHMKQKKIDDESGFDKYIKHFQDEKYCAICELTINHRGVRSTHADALEE